MDLGTYSESVGTLLPAGMRRLRLLKIGLIDTKPEYYEYKKDEAGNPYGEPLNPHRFEWTWLVVGGDNQGEQFKTWTNATINKGSTAAPIVEALLGRKMSPGERPRSDQIEGREIDCYVADKGEKGGTKNRIVDPKPAGGASVAAAAPRPTVPIVTVPELNQGYSQRSPTLTEELEADEPSPQEALGFARRRTKALAELAAMSEWEAACAEAPKDWWRVEIHGAELAKTPFPQLTTAQQYREVLQLEAWASGSEEISVPF